jgi:hypothetical protein
MEISVLLVVETGGPGENPQVVGSHRQTLSHNVVHLALIEIRKENKIKIKGYKRIMLTVGP